MKRVLSAGVYATALLFAACGGEEGHDDHAETDCAHHAEDIVSHCPEMVEADCEAACEAAGVDHHEVDDCLHAAGDCAEAMACVPACDTM